MSTFVPDSDINKTVNVEVFCKVRNSTEIVVFSLSCFEKCHDLKRTQGFGIRQSEVCVSHLPFNNC